MTGNFIQRSRHGTVFHFRRRVPLDLREVVGQLHIYVSLRTEERRVAIIRARLLAVRTDQLFSDLRTMPRDTRPKTLKTYYSLHIDLDELKESSEASTCHCGRAGGVALVAPKKQPTARANTKAQSVGLSNPTQAPLRGMDGAGPPPLRRG